MTYIYTRKGYWFYKQYMSNCFFQEQILASNMQNPTS